MQKGERGETPMAFSSGRSGKRCTPATCGRPFKDWAVLRFSGRKKEKDQREWRTDVTPVRRCRKRSLKTRVRQLYPLESPALPRGERKTGKVVVLRRQDAYLYHHAPNTEEKWPFTKPRGKKKRRSVQHVWLPPST